SELMLLSFCILSHSITRRAERYRVGQNAESVLRLRICFAVLVLVLFAVFGFSQRGPSTTLDLCVLVSLWFYSFRSILRGSTLVAKYAGSMLETNATPTSNIETVMNVATSVVRTP